MQLSLHCLSDILKRVKHVYEEEKTESRCSKWRNYESSCILGKVLHSTVGVALLTSDKKIQIKYMYNQEMIVCVYYNHAGILLKFIQINIVPQFAIF